MVKAHFVSTNIEVQIGQILSHSIATKLIKKILLEVGARKNVKLPKHVIKSTKNHQKRNNANNVRKVMVCEATVTPTPTLPPTIYHSRHSFQYDEY